MPERSLAGATGRSPCPGRRQHLPRNGIAERHARFRVEAIVNAAVYPRRARLRGDRIESSGIPGKKPFKAPACAPETQA